MSDTGDNDPLMTPRELLEIRRRAGALDDFPAPQAVIFAPQKSLATYAVRRHPSRRVRGFLGEFHLFKQTRGRVALSTGFGIGAPVVAGLADEFCALGVRTLVIVGMAGGIQQNLSAGSLVLATSALRGEGVSGHYLPAAPSVDASPELVDALRRRLVTIQQSHTPGPVWTTDAPFRELRQVVLEHQRRGILAVEMEAAGLLAVAEANKVAAAAVFSIADWLDQGKWRMDPDLRAAQAGLERAFDAVFDVLSESGDG